MHDNLSEFIHKNKDYCISFVVVIVVCAICAWLAYDYGRNEQLQENTNIAVERIDSVVERAGQRAESVERGISESEKAISGASSAVENSARASEEITGRIETCERLLDSIIQRHGRIANLISDIENSN